MPEYAAFFYTIGEKSGLAWEPAILNGNGSTPKEMHWNTSERLTGQHDALVAVSLTGIAG
jgi:hypothetical protein